MGEQDQVQWIQVRKANIYHYRDVGLYYHSGRSEYVLYKPAGETLSTTRIKEQLHPTLYIKAEDKEQAIIEMQAIYNRQLEESIVKGTLTDVKTILVDIVEETLSEPRSGTLKGMMDTVEIFMDGFSKQTGVIKTLAVLSFKDYTTALHSVNVMALTMGFSFYLGFDETKVKNLGLSALFHDLGKTKVPLDILNARRKLTEPEFVLMRNHPLEGHKILQETGFLDDYILRGALEHHEKLDGSGYPNGITNVSLEGRLLGIIDCYEAITNNDRPYRSAMEPLPALSLLKKEVEGGKLDGELFKKFAYSLV